MPSPIRSLRLIPDASRLLVWIVSPLLVSFAWLGCQHHSSTAESAPSPSVEAPDLDRLRAKLLPQIIRGYQRDENQVTYIPSWVLQLCRGPDPDEARLRVRKSRVSSAMDDRDHGKRMALFYANPIQAYSGLRNYYNLKPDQAAELPAGMWVVKSTWHAEPIAIDSVPAMAFDGMGSPYRRHAETSENQAKRAEAAVAQSSSASTNLHEVVAEKTDDLVRSSREMYVIEGDRAWVRGRREKTYMMYKPPADSPIAAETDDGWLYAVLNEDASQVIESGRIQRCMDCHASAKHEKLIGPPW